MKFRSRRKLIKGLNKWLKKNTWEKYYRAGIEEDNDTYTITIIARRKKNES